jgi:hypothetical protein
MKQAQQIVVVVLLTTLFLASCSAEKAPVKYSMAESTSTGCSTPEPGGIGACKVNAYETATVVPTQYGARQFIPIPTETQTLVPTQTPTLEIVKTQKPKSAQPYPTQSDAQGAISMDITPENLTQFGDKVIFDVSMNTHSVDLSMDLAKLASLSTETGKKVGAILWDAPRGGHHVQGKLSFPTLLDGKNLFDKAGNITITIKDVGAKSRIFTWKLTQ